MLYCQVICLSGDGAPATTGAQTSNGGGGGAGKYALGVFSAATVGTSQEVTIGAAGAANSGATVGNTSLGALITESGDSGSG